MATDKKKLKVKNKDSKNKDGSKERNLKLRIEFDGTLKPKKGNS